MEKITRGGIHQYLRICALLFLFAGAVPVLSAPAQEENSVRGIPPGIPEAGFIAEMKGEFKQAATIYRQHLNTQPHNNLLWLRLASVCNALKDTKGQAEALAGAAANTPEDADLQFSLMQAYSLLNEPGKALEVVKAAVRLEPDNIKFLMAQGQLANWNDENDLAMKSFQKVLLLTPDAKEARLALARTLKSANALKQAARAYQEYDPIGMDDPLALIEYIQVRAWLGKLISAQNLLHAYKKKYGESEQYIQEAKRIHTLKELSMAGIPKGIPYEGFVEEMAGRLDNAARIYSKALKKNPKNKILWKRLASLEALRNNTKNRIRALQGAVEADPNDIESLALLAKLFADEKELGKSIEYNEKAAALDPQNPFWMEQLANLSNWLGKHDDACFFFEKALLLSPNNPNYLVGLARSQKWAGNLDRAAALFEEYLGLVKNKPNIQIEYIQVLTWLGKYPQSIQELGDYRKANGINPEYSRERGRILALARKYHPTLGRTGAPEQVPDEGFEAEIIEDFKSAAKFYELDLKNNPDNTVLWLRLADVYAKLTDADNTARALQAAANLEPDDPAIQFRLMQGYSLANKPSQALEAVEKALALDPENITYLTSKGELCTWLGRYQMAAEIYGRILKLDPNHKDAELSLARSQKWGGELDKSVDTYKSYCANHPENSSAFIEYVLSDAARGNFGNALEMLEEYKGRFGEDMEYRKTKAKVLAWAGFPEASLALVAPLLELYPNDYEINYIRTIALHYHNQPDKAVDSLNVLEKLRPGSQETKNIMQFVTLPVRSNIKTEFDWYHDSDELNIYSSSISGALKLSPATKLTSRLDYDYLTATTGSGLETRQGETDISHESAAIGLVNRFSTVLSIDTWIGAGLTDQEESIIYDIGTDLKFSDNLSARLEHGHWYFLRSPRAISLDVRERLYLVSLDWKPDTVYRVSAQASYSNLSDDNNYWLILFTPRVAILRRQKLNLDLGFATTHFGYDKDLEHGYYDPEYYECYQLRAWWDWKIDGNNGVSAQASIGMLRDDTKSNFSEGQDLVVSGYFGIYNDLFLNLHMGAAHNLRIDDDPYNVFSIGAAVSYRF